jgi:hypothetical protein
VHESGAPYGAQETLDERVERILALVTKQDEY